MSVDALLTLRDDVEKALSGRAKELQDQLARLGRELSSALPLKSEVISFLSSAFVFL
jgi:hypothetical protein